MKKIRTLLITAAFASTAVLGGCSLVSEEYGTVNDTIFPQSEEDADMLVIGSAYEIFRLGQWAGWFSQDTYLSVGDISINKAGGYFPWNWGNYRFDMWPMLDPWNNYFRKLGLLEQTQATLAELPSSNQEVRERQIA